MLKTGIGSRMKWEKLSDHAISSGDWTISKALLDGTPRYTLWDGEVMIKVFRTLEEAKAMAERATHDIPA